MPDESELKKYIHKLEARIEALEKKAGDTMHGLSDKLFKLSPEATTADNAPSTKELRLVLMGPPGAGTSEPN